MQEEMVKSGAYAQQEQPALAAALAGVFTVQTRPEVWRNHCQRRTGRGQGTSVSGLNSAFPLCLECFYVPEHLRHGGSRIKMFMEPNPSWLLGFTFLVFSQKQQEKTAPKAGNRLHYFAP